MTALVAVYAAVVSTGALALEVRRWFESGPRLAMTVIPEAQQVGGPVRDDRVFVSVRVTNRGTQPTTVTNLGFVEFRRPWLRYFDRRTSRAAIVPMPGAVPQYQPPYLLQPGTEWTGMASYDDALREWVATDRPYVAVWTSHRSKPLLARLVKQPQRAKPPKGST